MTHTPFALPPRPPVTQIRGRTAAALRAMEGPRTQPMAGFEPHWRDIVDYIIVITEEIWGDRAVDRIYDTYAADCVVHTSMGTSRGVEGVVAGTIQSLWSFTDYTTRHLNVAWSGDESDFYTSHLGFATSINTGPTAFGPATGAAIGRCFVADCISRDNLIHTEWLARDTGAIVRQMGLDPLATAQAMAQLPAPEPLVPLPASEALPRTGDTATAQGYAAALLALWNARAFAVLGELYAADAVAHWPGLRTATGPRAITHLAIGLLAGIPDGQVRAEHVSWSEESDGPIVAVRWRIDGTSSPLGMLGPMPGGRPVALIGMSHFRFQHGRIAEEWTVFDEVAALVQALRA